jgi:hypothetical protein
MRPDAERELDTCIQTGVGSGSREDKGNSFFENKLILIDFIWKENYV